MMKTEERIKEGKIIAIARRVPNQDIVNTAKAILKGGVTLLEITFDQVSASCIEDTCEAIGLVKKALGDEMCVGAGTVLTEAQAEAAAKAGAEFALAPNTNIKLIKRIVELGMTAIPGAMTPSEIEAAYEAGAGFVKVFPAGNFGESYVKAVVEPLSQIPLLAVGGVKLDNMRRFMNAGCVGAGIGSGIIDKERIKAGDFEGITELAKKFMDQVQESV